MSRRTTPLTGRDTDVAKVDAVLGSFGWCVLVGPGGVGKTSVAQVVADRSGARCVWVDAEPMDRSDQAVLAALHLFGVELLPGDQPLVELIERLRTSDALLVLDG